MLSLSQIKQYYPEYLRQFKSHILCEYLQYKILDIIFSSGLHAKLCFLGGTALRIVYDNTRFSEDLDFDNFDLSLEDFLLLTKKIETGLLRLGYEVEVRNVFRNAFRCYIKFPNLLFENNISLMKEQKILIQFDTKPHNFHYVPDKKFLNKFDVFTQIFTTPLDILLSQKIFAILNRKRPKGRDYFDTIFLLQKTKPNYDYLKQKINTDNASDLKEKLIAHIDQQDIKTIIKDVHPFLFNPEDSKRIELFGEYIKQANL